MAPTVINHLNESGWYFGSLLIERGGDDLLRMQRTRIRLRTDMIAVHGSGKAMMDFVLNDRREILTGLV